MEPDDTSRRNWHLYQEQTLELNEKDTAFYNKYVAALPERGKILDIGAGSGRLSRYIHQKRPDLHIDALEPHIKPDHILKTNANGIHLLEMPIETLDMLDTYDHAFAINVLFFTDPANIHDIFKRIHHALKTGGTFYFIYTIANPDNTPNKLHTPERNVLRELLSTSGFTLDSTKDLGMRTYGAIIGRAPKKVHTLAINAHKSLPSDIG